MGIDDIEHSSRHAGMGAGKQNDRITLAMELDCIRL